MYVRGRGTRSLAFIAVRGSYISRRGSVSRQLKAPNFATPCLIPDTNLQALRHRPISTTNLFPIRCSRSSLSYHRAGQLAESSRTPRIAVVHAQVESQASQIPLLTPSTSPSKVFSPVKSWLSTTPTNLQHHTFSSTQFHPSHNFLHRIASLSARHNSTAHHHGSARRLPRAAW